MNDEAARPGRPDADRLIASITAEAERLRAGIWQALEALEAGDQLCVTDVLLALVDDGPDLREAA